MVGGLVAGFVCAAVIARLAFETLEAVWPEYAAAVPDRAYTLPMMWSRLAVAAVLTLVSGLVAALVAADRRAAWLFGTLLMLASLPSHLYYVWAAYPPWYHAIYLASLVPLSWVGGRAAPLSSRESSAEPAA